MEKRKTGGLCLEAAGLFHEIIKLRSQVYKSRAADGRLFAQELLHLFQSPTDPEHVRQADRLLLGPRSPYDQVAGEEPQKPVAEQVVALLLERQAGGVEVADRRPDVLTHLDLAG